MVINVQIPEISQMLFEMLEVMPPSTKESFAPRVHKMAALLEHPCCSDGAVLLTLGSDGTL